MVAYQRLFAPPRQDDLEYLPDPMGRLDMGTYVEKPETSPDPGWEAARGDWMRGAPLGRIFGDGLFDLQDGVGADQANRRGDVFKLQALLHREGFLDSAATEGPTGFWGGRDDEALRNFQKEHGLNVDGFAAPSGETISTIRGFYQPRRPTPAGVYTREVRGDEPPPSLRTWLKRPDDPDPPVLLRPATGHRADSAAEPQRFAQANTGVVSDVPPGSGTGRDERPVVNASADRIRSILENAPARFEIADNPKEDGSAPLWRLHNKGAKAVQIYDKVVEREATRLGVDPDLVRAVMYYENADGHKVVFNDLGDALGYSDTIMPMNINPKIWGALGVETREAARNPERNIRAAALLLKRIGDRLDDPTPEKIGSIWNGVGLETVNHRGARIGHIYRERSWEKPMGVTHGRR
ncbi:peptidoglycan-binding protein [Ferrovibrio terrae]|uniref:peptidoglycan-binding protein n=1 Tax=Ferrovibrio terrae TaxID=2594003 RepID=UPI0031378430